MIRPVAGDQGRHALGVVGARGAVADRPDDRRAGARASSPPQAASATAQARINKAERCHIRPRWHTRMRTLVFGKRWPRSPWRWRAPSPSTTGRTRSGPRCARPPSRARAPAPPSSCSARRPSAIPGSSAARWPRATPSRCTATRTCATPLSRPPVSPAISSARWTCCAASAPGLACGARPGATSPTGPRRWPRRTGWSSPAGPQTRTTGAATTPRRCWPPSSRG